MSFPNPISRSFWGRFLGPFSGLFLTPFGSLFERPFPKFLSRVPGNFLSGFCVAGRGAQTLRFSMCGLRRRPIWGPNLSSPFPKISEHLFRKILGDLAGRIRRSILVLILDVTSGAISGCIFGFNFWRSECIQVPSCQLAPREQCWTSPARRVAWATPAECRVRKSWWGGERKGMRPSASMWCTCCACTHRIA